MRIKWLGHACFLLTSENGTRVVTDPFDKTVGYAAPAVEADIVTTSHNHFDHNHVSVVRGDFIIIDGAGSFSEKGINITGVSAFHDENKGAKRGANIIYRYDIDGVKVCHCGDLGHVLSPEQVSEIGEADVLLIPVGGTYTLDAAGASEVVRQLRAAVTIPMHYKTPAINFPIDGVDKFLAAAGGGYRAGAREIEVTGENLSSLPKVIVLEY